MSKTYLKRQLSRRKFMGETGKLVGAISFTGALAVPWNVSFGQDPPLGCPTPPKEGTPFVPGKDTRRIVERKAVRLLSLEERRTLHQAFEALRALPSSDPRSWVQQADLHALFCDMCSYFHAQIHGSWNFFPWHRAYLYYYERILGALMGKLDTFRLPYWDWETQRDLPMTYIYPPNNMNSLWDSSRNTGMTKQGSPPLPLQALPDNDGTQMRVDLLNSITDFTTFGGDADNEGVFEKDPHNLIHSDVAKELPPGSRRGDMPKDMGNLGYAARDPIFFAHHANIDKLWSDWNGLAGGPGLPTNAYTNPTDVGFLNLRWPFYDENKQVVSISAADVLDHEKNLRYSYQPRLKYVRIYEITHIRIICCDPERGSRLEVEEAVRRVVLDAVRAERQVNLVLRGVKVPNDALGNFAVYAIRAKRRIRIGQFGILGESEKMRETDHRGASKTLLIDVSKAAEDLLSKQKPAQLRAIAERGTQGFALKAEKAELRIQKP
jgi:polyphenol oxidase